ncbi:1-phosphofructokinase family hexose kinase [Mycobacterium intracellulare]|uniref:1-phosphofructokinase family hexose kinase n=1 Tax=Mycobacterium intracellulare subsp. chimaera TaxID=222805 RepID=A0A7U5RVS4_MYCIT|nr:1-phosphofructokinase family hexose kinase [Mycobacterium intracellulare]ASL15159.1 phosphofructokinase, PfkB [Mycobacterium intracellulare subsp. chimaera]ASQ89194.1 phosphofructokinase [Mycobacterium intracellulare subsp. chimaera]MCF1811685.1 1-phosphofructokinase family hexose kinase [Mycobacterium intracellulare subsp. intracellulare]MDM3929463.1 1-phosphofructokinase family hexose kinase [Mycobacterium intracellulare subsp. chimaera]MDS0333204.1 1-phosphofructokinase family hexose kin
MNVPAESVPGRVQLVTLTMNPALDITTSIDLVRPTDKMRCETTCYDPGGGGINVARVGHVLGVSVSAVFTVGGPTGALVASLVRDEGVPCRQIEIAAPTRESFTVNENSSGQQYRFVLPGPLLSFPEQSRCLDRLWAEAQGADFVVASGSLPPGVPPDYYQRVADICRDVDCRLVLDTSGGGLRHISSGVFLLKASVRELGECVGRPLATEQEQLAAAHALIENGCAQVVLVSLGSRGALLATQHASQRFPAIPLRGGGSGVGAGDAMVAAITAGLIRGWPLVKSVRLGIAAGAAMSMTPGTEVCSRAAVERLFALAAEPSDLAPGP